MTAMPSIFCKHPVTRRVLFLCQGGDANDKQPVGQQRIPFYPHSQRLLLSYKLSPPAVLLYGLMLDRMQLSSANDWKDADGQVYIHFTVESIYHLLHCGHDKAVSLLRELEETGLLRRVRRGQGRPSRLYVLPFTAEFDNSAFWDSEKPTSKKRKIRIPDFGKTEANKNDTSNINFNNINLSVMIEDRIRVNIDYIALAENYDRQLLDETVRLMADVISGTRATERIGKQEHPTEQVRERFLSLKRDHIEYVLDRLKENGTEIRNYRAYLLTALYNAPVTMTGYYDALVRYHNAKRQKTALSSQATH